MIYKISGTIIHKDGGKVAIDTGGVAYDISLPLSTYAQLPAVGEKAAVYTHFIMKEDGAALYGFKTLEEKSIFLKLISVSKIGPKLGLAILGNIDGNALAQAISTQDADRLSKIPGIGKKTAERIILELKDKIGGYEPVCGNVAGDAKSDVISALMNLGYKPADCRDAVTGINDGDFQTILRKALNKLNG